MEQIILSAILQAFKKPPPFPAPIIQPREKRDKVIHIYQPSFQQKEGGQNMEESIYELREAVGLEEINRLLATGRWKVRSLDWDDEIPVAKLVRNKR